MAPCHKASFHNPFSSLCRPTDYKGTQVVTYGYTFNARTSSLIFYKYTGTYEIIMYTVFEIL